MSVLAAFADELVKISASLNEEERNRQAAQFAGVGALASPAISGIGNMIEHGKVLPRGSTSPARWLGRTGTTGALFFGAVPIIRNEIVKKNLEGARQRRLEATGG